MRTDGPRRFLYTTSGDSMELTSRTAISINDLQKGHGTNKYCQIVGCFFSPHLNVCGCYIRISWAASFYHNSHGYFCSSFYFYVTSATVAVPFLALSMVVSLLLSITAGVWYVPHLSSVSATVHCLYLTDVLFNTLHTAAEAHRCLCSANWTPLKFNPSRHLMENLYQD